jgi:hypothetical protein
MTEQNEGHMQISSPGVKGFAQHVDCLLGVPQAVDSRRQLRSSPLGDPMLTELREHSG